MADLSKETKNNKSIRNFCQFIDEVCSTQVNQLYYKHLPSTWAYIALKAVLGIRMFLGHPDPDPLVRGTDPDPDPALFS
jgi:hypothetical protein